MKSILLPIDQSEQIPSALETARLAADLFDSTVEGVALRPAFDAIVAYDVAIAMPPAYWDETEFCRTVHQTFHAYAAQRLVEHNKGARFRWRAVQRSTTALWAAWRASTISLCSAVLGTA